MKTAFALALYFLAIKGQILKRNENVAKPYFTGAVFEYAKTNSLKYNIQEFEQATSEAAKLGAEIVIFPESGILTTSSRASHLPEIIPNPKTTHFNPCLQKQKNDSAVLVPMSCMALKYRITILANTIEKVLCNYTHERDNENCPEDGQFHYNTNVVFDSTGRLIARYRKRFLFFEPNTNIPPKPESIVFETSFGRFGTLICFDILFNEAINLIEKNELDAVIVSTYWFDELPFLSSIQYYQSWAVGNGVNLLMANIHHPEIGAIGSLISYGGKNAYIHNSESGSTLIVAKVPKKISENSLKSINYKPSLILANPNANKSTFHHTITNFDNYTLVKLTKASDKLKACNNGLCCKLKYSTTYLADNHYYLGSVNGTKSVQGKYSWAEEVCVLFACSNLSNKSCQIIPMFSNTIFNHIVLKGNFSTKYIYPSVLANDMTLIAKENWDYIRGIGKIETGKGVNIPLISVSLFGRCYGRDPPYKK